MSTDEKYNIIALLTILDSFMSQKLEPGHNGRIEKACYTDIEHDERAFFRDALYQEPSFYDDFLKHNYYDLSAEDLAIIERWAEFGIRDYFLVEEYEKKKAYFVWNGSYYLVHNLIDDFPTIFKKRQAPFWIYTYILPYKDIIVYDGIVGPIDLDKKKVISTLECE